jgi:molecular chaperone DnaK (HSP70)
MSNQLASAIGIDMGTSRSVIAAAIRGGVEILCNEGSFRETPNTVGYGDVQRYLGNEGVSKKKGNFKSTLEFFSRFLGMNSDSPDILAEKAHVYCPTAFNEAGRLIFKPRYQGEQIEILPEQALASMLTKIRTILELNNISNKEIVMSVPSYYTQVERKLALLAGRIAGLNIIKLMNESTATVLNYGIFRKKDLSEDPRLVAFVDVGHSKTSITFAKVKKMGAEIVLEKTDRNLGGRDFDLLLFKEYQKRFENKENMDLNEYPKSKMRILDAIEKQRKQLSANADAPINVEYLCEDIDFADTMSRDEFEKLCAPLLAKFGVLIKECFTEAGFTTKEFHSVEVIGGCTRTPALQQMIQQTFAIDEVSRTLNQSESIARGCAIQAAIKSPLFQVAEYTIPERNVSVIKCKYSVEKLGEGGIFETKEYNNTLFKKNCEFPTVMTISVSKATKASLQLFYEEEKPVHSQQMLVDVDTKPYKIKEDDYKILLKGKIDDNGIIGLKCVELEETYLEEVKTLIKKKPETKEEQVKREETKKAEEAKKAEANGETTAPVDGEQKP